MSRLNVYLFFVFWGGGHINIWLDHYSLVITLRYDTTGSNLKGEDVILASSIGLFVGIIAGVVALIVILAVIVLCCCCKPFKSQQLPVGCGKAEATRRAAQQQPALPTGQYGGQ